MSELKTKAKFIKEYQPIPGKSKRFRQYEVKINDRTFIQDVIIREGNDPYLLTNKEALEEAIKLAIERYKKAVCES